MSGNGTPGTVPGVVLMTELDVRANIKERMSFGGDVTGLDVGPDNVIVMHLAPTGVEPGSYGSATKIPVLTVDEKGRVTGVTLVDVVAPVSLLQQAPQLGWKDITSELVSRGGSSAPALSIFRGGIYAYKFSAGGTDQLYSTFHIPHDYAPGTQIYIHIHWSDSAAAPTGVVRWGFEFTYAKGHGQAAFSAPQVVYVEQQCTLQYQHMIAEVPLPVPVADLEVDGLVVVRIFRDGPHASDTSPNGSFAFTCDIHYQCDRVATPNRAPNFYATSP